MLTPFCPPPAAPTTASPNCGDRRLRRFNNQHQGFGLLGFSTPKLLLCEPETNHQRCTCQPHCRAFHPQNPGALSLETTDRVSHHAPSLVKTCHFCFTETLLIVSKLRTFNISPIARLVVRLSSALALCCHSPHQCINNFCMQPESGLSTLLLGIVPTIPAS